MKKVLLSLFLGSILLFTGCGADKEENITKEKAESVKGIWSMMISGDNGKVYEKLYLTVLLEKNNIWFVGYRGADFTDVCYFDEEDNCYYAVTKYDNGDELYYAFLEVDMFDEVKGIFEYYNKIENATYGDYDFSGYRVSKTLETTRSITHMKRSILKSGNINIKNDAVEKLNRAVDLLKK